MIMAKLENTVECIETLMKKMSGNSITKLEYSCEEFELKLETASAKTVCVQQTAPAVSAPIASAPVVAEAQAAVAVKGNIVKSPIVGTYYNSPAPDKAPFVTVGQTVKKGDVLMIIESMKLMNEIQSEFDGVVAEIMVANGTAVEFEQPLMRIE